MLKDRIEKYIKDLEEQIEISQNDLDLAKYNLALRLVISDLQFMLMEEL